MYMFTQKESEYTAQLLWHDWFPAVWLDEHQMGSNGARIFVMPATDPINPNVHPLIYRWNGILGQSQAAALEAAGKEGIIYNSTYTNFWQGAMAWSGWWHNQIGLLTELASARVAAPIDQQRAIPGRPAPVVAEPQAPARRFESPPVPLAPPTDIRPRTEYPRPWMGGRWTLRDIVDYELIATMALIETAADRRETILRQIYEVNRATVEAGKIGDVTAVLAPLERQQDAREVRHLVDRLRVGGVEVYRADAAFEADGQSYSAGTFVIPMTQVFARYAKDMLEKQTYPEVRRGPNAPIEPPYDVSAWSLGLQLGVDTVFVKNPLPSSLTLTRIGDAPADRRVGVPAERVRGAGGSSGAGTVNGSGTRFTFDYVGADTAIAINRLLKDGARVAFDGPSRVSVGRVPQARIQALAAEFGLAVTAGQPPPARVARRPPGSAEVSLRAPRVGMYQPWTGGNMDEGWTRWVLEQYEFDSTPLHNAAIRAGKLRQKFDAIILPEQNPRDIVSGYESDGIRPEYRGGIGEAGVDALKQFIADGGTLVTMGAACDLAIDRLPIPVRNVKRGLARDQHSAPGTIVRVQVDTTHPIGYGMAKETYGFYNNSPFFALVEGFASQNPTVVARYPNTEIVGSGWLRGEELMTGRAAVVSIEMHPGRVILFGLRPQHRAQTHATFPMLFNALYMAAAGAMPAGGSQD
jgi:hypothetical protein